MATRNSARAKKSASVLSKSIISPPSSTTSSSRHFFGHSNDDPSSPADSERSKENVTATVRFRPLSPREIRQGEEVAWYADGDTIVRSEYNPSTAYAYDRVFGPTTTTRHVYDVAAQHVVSSAMEGVNGTIFAYGVTSSGKTHTMHGDQRSPGIIPLAVKDAFNIIQETPSREFLLRVSYLEIYNEVINDLLDPAGQNLRIREDHQGPFVEGVKEEVVLSPAHALSLIATGEEHRHIGSNNFNLLSSRSHTIFTLTIESSPCGECGEGEAVNFSQLNLIDLAGSESSRAETTGLRRKEGSYINKSLLTLGTVIAKLTDGRAAHIPYRDSKLTRLLQTSLSGHGRVSLICTVTPSSSNAEETHNTLKFAHRAKHIEIQASQNKIGDENSLIKKYQHEIRSLKEELEQLKRGIFTVPLVKDIGDDDIVLLKQKLEDGQVKLQSRLEQEEEAKAALLSRIQRLTKLILVSTKTTQPSRFPQRPDPSRRHSFGEEELAYLPYRRRDLISDEENIDSYYSLEGSCETIDEPSKEKKSRKNGLLNWFKMKKRDNNPGALLNTDDDRSSGTRAIIAPIRQKEFPYFPADTRLSNSLMAESHSHTDFSPDEAHDREHHSDNFCEQETPLTSIKTADHIDILREQLRILSGEVALHSSALKRMSEEAANNPKKEQIHMEMKKLNEEIRVKKQQITILEKQMGASHISEEKMNAFEASESYAELLAELNEKAFELEVKTADNRVIQDQLNQKIQECEELQETVNCLEQQLSQAVEYKHFEMSLNKETKCNTNEKMQLLAEIKELKQNITELTEIKDQLETRNQKLAEESSYAKGLASAAAVELKALSEEVSKLMTQNERLTSEISTLRSPTQRRVSNTTRVSNRRDNQVRRSDQTESIADMKRELALYQDRELSYEAALMDKAQRESEFHKKFEESKQREAYLENELANMWVLVAKLKNTRGGSNDNKESEFDPQNLII